MEFFTYALTVAVVLLAVSHFGLREKHRQLNSRLNGEVHGIRKSFKKSLDLNSDHMHRHVNDLVKAIRELDESQVLIGNDIFKVLEVLASDAGYELTFNRPKGGANDIKPMNHTMGGPSGVNHAPLVLIKKAPKKKAPARRRR